MRHSPEARLLEVVRALKRLRSAKAPLTVSEIFLRDGPLSTWSARRLVAKFVKLGVLTRDGETTPARYYVSCDDEVLNDFIDTPVKLSEVIWGEPGQESEESADEEVPANEESPEEEEESQEEQQMVQGDVSLRGIAENQAALTELVVEIFKRTPDDGARPAIDLAPFVKSFVGVHEELRRISAQLAGIEKALGLKESNEDDRRGSQ
jgi:hypothetical protein